MAAGKPIISSPIQDVVESFANGIRVARSKEEWVNSINYYLYETASQARERIYQQNLYVNNTSWDRTVENMKRIMITNRAQKLIQTQKNNSSLRQVLTSFSITSPLYKSLEN
jgi:hypothetical protein